MSTGSDLLTAALFDLNVVAAGETPSSEDFALALTTANRLLDRWATQSLIIHTLLRTVKTLANAKATYTVGVGGDINIARPVQLAAVTLIQDSAAIPPLEIPLRVFTDAEWIGLGLKGMTGGYVQGVYYDYADVLGLATLQVWPVPNIGSTQLVLYTPQALTAITLAADYVFPPGYEEAFVSNLAKRLAIPFSKPVSPDLAELAATSLADVKRTNMRLSDLEMPWPVGAYSILSDTYIRGPR